MMNPRKSEANKPPKLPETTKAHKPRSQLLGPKSCKEQKGKSKKPRSEKAKRHKGHTKATQKPHKSFKKTWATKAKKLPATRLHIPLVVTESLGANCALFIKKMWARSCQFKISPLLSLWPCSCKALKEGAPCHVPFCHPEDCQLECHPRGAPNKVQKVTTLHLF